MPLVLSSERTEPHHLTREETAGYFTALRELRDWHQQKITAHYGTPEGACSPSFKSKVCTTVELDWRDGGVGVVVNKVDHVDRAIWSGDGHQRDRLLNYPPSCVLGVLASRVRQSPTPRLNLGG